jgi:rubredoxin
VSEDQAPTPNDPRDARTLPARPVCPSCGSEHTQPFTQAGPAARENMKCLNCGHLFKHRTPRD